ncbi:glycerol-3-phosphate phosphatase [Drosophila bipectinata]|uniref:glycerol-3-phosphate phosphatase n=1 Tax=Drosophila bipectinata TaxID=42026 RepID=UPI001C8A34DC|nr:glycerol-3-phosphate phosphatase [Drosophila bipectinata]
MNLALNRKVAKGGCQLLGLNKYSIHQYLKTIDTILYDADGVLWQYDKPIRGAVETFNALRAMGKKSYICTNNSSDSAFAVWKKAKCMDLLVAKDEVLTSGQATARYLSEQKFKRKVYAIGGQGIVDELKLVGISCLPLDPPNTDSDFINKIVLDRDVGAVVVGMDKDFDAQKITKATWYLRDPDVMFVATNRDLAYSVAPGRMIPGAGVMVAAIQAASLRAPYTCGKPKPHLCSNVIRQGLLQPERTLMVGDTMSTDIQLGYNCSFQTLLVGTGVSSYKDVLAAQESSDPFKYQEVPHKFVSKLSHLLPFLCSRNR